MSSWPPWLARAGRDAVGVVTHRERHRELAHVRLAAGLERHGQPIEPGLVPAAEPDAEHDIDAAVGLRVVGPNTGAAHGLVVRCWHARHVRRIPMDADHLA